MSSLCFKTRRNRAQRRASRLDAAAARSTGSVFNAMANFAPLVGEEKPGFRFAKTQRSDEEGDANKSTPGMKWPRNYARPAKCNDFLPCRSSASTP